MSIIGCMCSSGCLDQEDHLSQRLLPSGCILHRESRITPSSPELRKNLNERVKHVVSTVRLGGDGFCVQFYRGSYQVIFALNQPQFKLASLRPRSDTGRSIICDSPLNDSLHAVNRKCQLGGRQMSKKRSSEHEGRSFGVEGVTSKSETIQLVIEGKLTSCRRCIKEFRRCKAR